MKKRLLLTAVIGGLSAASASAVEVTGNAGVVSEYIFRGIESSDGKAAAQGGIDVGFDNGIYLGTWGSKVDFGDGNDGVEIDLYGGYSGEVEDFTYGIGATLYNYTDNADEDYAEINLSAGWKWFTIDYAIGEYDDRDGDVDYDHFSITVESEGLYAKYGSNGDDLWDGVDADYFEFGYGSTAAVNGEDLFDYSIAFIDSDDGLLLGSSSNRRLIFGIVKNFEIASN